MNKRFLAGIFALTLALSAAVAPVTGFADEVDTISAVGNVADDYEYTNAVDYNTGKIRDDQIIITKYKGSATEVEIPEKILDKTVVQIYSLAFQDTEVTKITVPDTVYDCGFNCVPKLEEIKLPVSLKYIYERMFENCPSLKSITIPKAVEFIDGNAFNGCDALTDVNIDPENKSYTVIDNVIYSSDLTSLVFVPHDRTTYKIPASVTNFYHAFTANTGLESITIPKTVTTIESYAFMDCTALKSVTFEDGGIAESNPQIFLGCKSLTDVKLPEGLTDISWYMFIGCESLEHIDIPSSVNHIYEEAFRDCPALKKVELGKYVDVDDHAFGYTFDYDTCKFTPVEDFTIRCYINSKAYRYATTNGFNVEYIAKSIKGADVKVNNKTFTGKALKPGVKVTLEGVDLVRGTDYTVTYSNNVDPGKGIATITAKGAYTGTVKGTFAVKPKKVKTLRLTAKSGRRIKAAWTKYSKVSGYQLQISKDDSYKNATRTVHIKGGANNTRLMSNFWGGYYYYARVRAYVSFGGKKYYGAWSDVAQTLCKW